MDEFLMRCLDLKGAQQKATEEKGERGAKKNGHFTVSTGLN